MPPAAGDEGRVLHPVRGAWRCRLGGSQQHKDHVRVGESALQVLVHQLLSEGHLLLRVPALPVPADHALLHKPNTSIT